MSVVIAAVADAAVTVAVAAAHVAAAAPYVRPLSFLALLITDAFGSLFPFLVCLALASDVLLPGVRLQGDLLESFRFHVARVPFFVSNLSSCSLSAAPIVVAPSSASLFLP